MNAFATAASTAAASATGKVASASPVAGLIVVSVIGGTPRFKI